MCHYRGWLERRNDDNRKVFCKYRNKVTQLIKNAKRKFGLKYFDVNQPSTALWRKVKDLGITKNSDSDFNGISSNEFCNLFASVQSRASLPRFDQNISESLNACFKYRTHCFG